MAQEKEYYAFISYQRKDEEWADRLRNKLEHYRLPSSVRKQDASLPKEIRPIFRDALELAGGVLAKEIETALQNSKYLIVICSPNSSKSPWVNKEIQTFIDLGHEDRIIPYIIEGTPFSENEETECFPPALRSLKGEKELLGININELSRDAASIKVVARMFGLKFDTLWQRYEREKNKKRWMLIGGAFLFALVSLGIGGYIAKKNIELDETVASLESANKEIKSERDRANAERNRANSERNKAEVANISLMLANDSIRKAYLKLNQSEKQLKESNYDLLMNQAKILAKKSKELLNDGDSYSARLLSIEALSSPYPYSLEAECVLMNAMGHNSAILRGHMQPVNSFAFSPDGKLLASASDDGMIKIWDTSTGCQLYSLKDNSYYRHGILSIAFSPDGNTIVAGSDLHTGTITLWDLRTQKIIKEWRVSSDTRKEHWVYSVAYSPDGETIVSASSDGCVKKWGKTGDLIKTLTKYNHIANTVLYSKDGKWLVSASANGSINIWDSRTGDSINTIKASNNVRCISISKNGKRLVSGSGNNKITVWDLNNNSIIKILEGHNSWVSHVSYSNDEKYLFSSSGDGTIKIWETKSWNCIKTLSKHNGPVNYVTQSVDGKYIASSSDDGTVRFWDYHFNSDALNTKAIGVTEKILRGHTDNVNYTFYSSDRKYLVSASDDKSVRIWDGYTGDSIKSLKGFPTKIYIATISPNGKWIISSSMKKNQLGSYCRIWNFYTNKGDCLKDDKNMGFMTALYSPNGKYIVMTNYNTIYIWDANSKKRIGVLEGHKLDVRWIAFYRDGKRIVSASSDNTLRIWDLEAQKCLKVLEGHENSVSYVAVNGNDSQIVSGSWDKTIKIWDANTGEEIQTLIGHDNWVNSVEFSSDNQRIISSSDDGTIKIWNAKTGEEMYTIKCGGRIHSAVFNSKGTRIVASNNNFIRFLDFPPLQELIGQTRERFKNRKFTPEERRKYYLK